MISRIREVIFDIKKSVNQLSRTEKTIAWVGFAVACVLPIPMSIPGYSALLIIYTKRRAKDITKHPSE